MAERRAESEYWDPHHNEICEGGLTIAEFQSEADCDFAVYRLRQQDIRSGVLLPERRLDLRWPQVRVTPDDEKAARQILAQPVEAAERAEYDAAPDVAPFATPRCPKCGSGEIVLEAVETENVWRCDVCGESWTEILSISDVAPPGE